MALPEPVEGQPGIFVDPDTGERFELRDAFDDDIYDTISIAAGAIAAGSEFVFFQDIGGKRFIDTNIRKPNSLAPGERLLLDNIGNEIRLAGGDVLPNPSDVKKVAYNGLYEARISGKLVARGPLYKYPSGYGLSGQTQEAGQGVLSIGVASTAARAGMARKHLITGDRHDVTARLAFEPRGWAVGQQLPQNVQDPVLENVVLVTTMWHGLRSAPSTN